MTRIAFLLGAAMLAAAPASATIIIYSDPGSLQPDENVLFESEQTGNPVFGSTNQTGTGVTFQANEVLTTPSAGQARVEADDEGLGQLEFFLTDETLGFTEVEFNIFGTGATADSVTLNFEDQFGNIFSDSFEIDQGENFFSALAIDGQLITNVSFLLNGDVADVRQVRIGGITEIGVGSGTVPEPASWALMIGGFGLVGMSLRRRRVTLTPVTN